MVDEPLFMLVPVMQIRIVRMLVGNRIVGVQMRMPLADRKGFVLVCMLMMPVIMPVVMNVLHHHMGVPVFMSRPVGSDNGQRQKSNGNRVNPLKRFMNN